MARVNFKFDKEKELWTLWDTATASSSWADRSKAVDPKIVDICKGKEFEECKKDLEKFNEGIYSSGLIENYLHALEKSWRNIEDEYFNRLEKIMNHPIQFDEITAYATTSRSCPYDPDEPSFMVSLMHPFPYSLATAGHEMMHIQFHKTYWPRVEEKIGEEKTGDLKEALTVLLNSDFKDLWFVDDQGYAPHQELRKFISEQWEKEKDFEKLLDKCVDHLRN